MRRSVTVAVSTLLLLAIAWIIISVRASQDELPFTNTPQLPNNVASNLVQNGFDPAANNRTAFEATMKIIPQTGPEFEAFILHDGEGSVRFEGKEDGELLEYYLTPEYAILCTGLDCVQAENDTSDPFFDTQTFSYSPGELDAIAPQMQFQRETACGDATCEEWLATDEASDVTRVVIDKDSRRIVTIEGFIEQDFLTTSFTYKDVDIVLPLNVQR